MRSRLRQTAVRARWRTNGASVVAFRLRRIGEQKLEVVFGERLRDGTICLDDGARERALPLGKRADLFLDRADCHHAVRGDRTRLSDTMRSIDGLTFHGRVPP